MGKLLTEMQKFYIDNHHETTPIETLAKIVGCTSRTIYNHLNRNKGDQRTEQGRDATKEEVTEQPVVPQEQSQQANQVNPHALPASPTPLPLPGLHLIGIKKHGNSGAAVMTKEASEVGDEVAKLGQTKMPKHVYLINPEKS